MEMNSLFEDVFDPVGFWSLIRDGNVSIKEVAVNLHKLLEDEDVEMVISWILDKRSNYYIGRIWRTFEENPDRVRSLLFNQCVRMRYYREVKMLLNHQNVNPGTFHNLALRDAVKNNDVEMVQLLLKDERVDPTDVNFDAIKTAISQGYPSIVSLLIWNEKTIESLDENIVRKWRNDIPYRTSIWDILTRFIDRLNRSTIYLDSEREHKRVKEKIFSF
jgi:hypothetical protein